MSLIKEQDILLETAIGSLDFAAQFWYKERPAIQHLTSKQEGYQHFSLVRVNEDGRRCFDARECVGIRRRWVEDFKHERELDLEESELCADLRTRGEEVAEDGHKLQKIQISARS